MKKKYLQQKTQVKHLIYLLAKERLEKEQLCAKLAHAQHEKREAQGALKRIERNIEEMVGKHAALLGVKDSEVDGEPEKLYQDKRHPYKITPFDSSLAVELHVLERLEVQLVQEALSELIIRVVDHRKQTQTTGRLKLYYMTPGALASEPARFAIVRDVVQALIERIAKA